MAGGLFNSNFVTLSSAMDASALRHRVISQNIANAETPGYKRKEVVFEDVLREALSPQELRIKKEDPRHFSNYPENIEDVQARMGSVRNTWITNDGNNVDIDQEMAVMAANSLRYQTLARLMDQNIVRYNIILKGTR
ncbi:MAG TPA: flagellar basal body rod protein FlgB [Thermotogota bacterium]|nr:flagellar basal body rod protein FlgB [Thermotogota bacterium]